MDWAKAALFRTRLVSYIRPDNAPSISVAKALGAVREGTIQLLGHEAEVWAYRL
jgi:RimJ/RimL family protein N-acetyltransferase